MRRHVITGALALSLICSVLAGCAPEERAVVDGSEQIPCVVEEYPCDLNDVPQDVMDATFGLSDEAAELYVEDEGDTARMVDLLRAHEQVVAVDEYDSEVVFRLEAGRPHHLYTAPTYYETTEELDFELPPAPAEPVDEETTGQEGEPEPSGGVGSIHVAPEAYQPAGDPAQGHDIGMKRRALVLEPLGPMAGEASGKNYARQLSHESTNIGDVTYIDGKSGYTSGFYDALLNLGAYEMVHISTHGTQLGFAGPLLNDLIERTTDLKTYSMEDLVDIPKGVNTAAELPWNVWDYPHQEINKNNPDRLVSIVTTEFWQIHYPGGLRDTIFYADWCNSLEDTEAASAITAAISTYIGWDDAVEVRHAAFAASWFWRYMSMGVDVRTAMHALERDGYTTFRGGELETGEVNAPGQAQMKWVGADLRMLDAVTSFVDAETRIMSGTKLDWSGELGDGERDTLDTLRLEVVGVPTGEAGAASLTVYLDNQKFRETFNLSEAVEQPSDNEGWATWILELTEVELPFDVTQEILQKEMPWEVRVTDGSGGHGAHSVRKVSLRSVDVEATHPQALARLALSGEIVHVNGTEGDGRPDEVPVVITVRGVASEDAGNYVVRTRLSGGTLVAPREAEWRLGEFQELSDDVFRLQFDVLLDRDLTDDNNDFTIDTRLFGFGEEVSEHVPTVQLEGRMLSACSIDLTWSGAARDSVGLEPVGDGSTVPPMSEDNTGTEYEEQFDATTTSGRDQREGELIMYLSYRTDDKITLIHNALKDWGGSVPVAAPQYNLDLAFDEEISAGATGTFTVPMTLAESGIMLTGLELWLPDLDSGVYRGPMTITITESDMRPEKRVLEGTSPKADFLSGTFEATVANGPDGSADRVSVAGSFNYSRSECF